MIKSLTLAGILLLTIGCSTLPSNSDEFTDCPPNESDGIYPNCTCRQKNFDYSATWNVCFRVCPENSDGYWPNCTCHFGAYFSKKYLECNTITCPDYTTGEYPDCSCNDNDAEYINATRRCEKCKDDSYGKFPNCTCPNGGTYERQREICVQDCVWERNGDGSKIDDYCLLCPGQPYDQFESTGTYPNCTCTDSSAIYDEFRNECVSCPYNSAGVPPNCVCEDPGSSYSMDANWCYAACPPNSTGTYPNCKCDSDKAYFVEGLNTCLECPINASTGVYPACECHDANYTYSAIINRCYIPCPHDSYGIHPNCDCGDEFVNFYDIDDRACKRYDDVYKGRPCPPDSIGIGPDCLCILETARIFFSHAWKCANTQPRPGHPHYYCPDRNDKWPQCNTSIDKCVLLSCIG